MNPTRQLQLQLLWGSKCRFWPDCQANTWSMFISLKPMSTQDPGSTFYWNEGIVSLEEVLYEIFDFRFFMKQFPSDIWVKILESDSLYDN